MSPLIKDAEKHSSLPLCSKNKRGVRVRFSYCHLSKVDETGVPNRKTPQVAAGEGEKDLHRKKRRPVLQKKGGGMGRCEKFMCEGTTYLASGFRTLLEAGLIIYIYVSKICT